MECNFLEKKSEEFVELFYSGLLSAIGCQADYDDTFEAIVMKEHDKDKISSQYSNIFLDWIKKNMLERNCKPGWV
jgi:hypothetical protein